jgi:hypothetical protein
MRGKQVSPPAPFSQSGVTESPGRTNSYGPGYLFQRSTALSLSARRLIARSQARLVAALPQLMANQ